MSDVPTQNVTPLQNTTPQAMQNQQMSRSIGGNEQYKPPGGASRFIVVPQHVDKAAAIWSTAKDIAKGTWDVMEKPVTAALNFITPGAGTTTAMVVNAVAPLLNEIGGAKKFLPEGYVNDTRTGARMDQSTLQKMLRFKKMHNGVW